MARRTRRLSAELGRMCRLVQRVPAVDPRQDLTATLQALDLPALLSHYRDYLRRAKQTLSIDSQDIRLHTLAIAAV